MTDLRALLAARTAPGTWERRVDDGIFAKDTITRVYDDHEKSSLIAWCHSDYRNVEDARAIVAMDHIIDPALAVVEAARGILATHLRDHPNPCTDPCYVRDARRALAAFDAAVEEATRP